MKNKLLLVLSILVLTTIKTFGQVLCVTPTNLTTTNITSNSATVAWAANNVAAGYNVQYKATQATTFTNLTVQTNSINLTNLTGLTTYEIKVQAICMGSNGSGNTTSTFSNAIAFTTLGNTTSCGVPTNLTTTNITSNSATLGWAAVSGAVSYNVKYLIAGSNNPVVVSVQTNTLNLANLVAATNYEFIVQAVCNSNGVTTTSAYSSGKGFITLHSQTGCGVPFGLGTNNITGSSVTLTWTAVTGAAYYNVKYIAAGTNNLITVIAQTNSLNLTNLSAATTYEFYVQTVCGSPSAPTTSAYSTGKSFTTLGNTTSCGVPANLGKTNIAATTIKLTWNAVSGANSYNIQYRIVNTTAWISATSQTNYVNLTNLTAASRYEFKVQSVCGSGTIINTSAYSAIAFFETLHNATGCGVPTNLGKTNLTSSSATLSWNAVAGANSYNVRYRIFNTTTWININTNTTVIIVNGLAPATKYEFQVQTVCGASNNTITTSAFSSSAYFETLNNTTGCGIPTNLGSTNITANSAKVTWNAVAGASFYSVKYRVANTNNWTSMVAQTNFINLVNLVANTSYEFQVQTVCGNASNNTISSAFSASAFFITLNHTTNGCGKPTNVNITHLTLNSAKLNWNTVTGAHTYQVRYKVNNSTANWTVVTTTNNFYQLNGLASNGSYVWQVQSVCLGGNVTTNILSDWSVLHTFSTPQQLVMGPNPANNVIEMYYTTNTTQNVQLTIINATGKQLVNTNQSVNQGENKIEFNSTNLENGIYFVEINGSEGRHVKKVYIQHN